MYESQLSWLESGLSSMVHQETGFPVPAVEVPTIAEEADDGALERLSSLFLEFAGILLCASKQGDGRMVMRIFDLLADIFS